MLLLLLLLRKFKNKMGDFDYCQRRSCRRPKILEIFSQHRRKDCLLYAKPFDNTKNINLFNNADFFRCIKHLQNKHADVFFTNTASFEINLKESKQHFGIIRHLNDMFFIDLDINNKTDKISLKVTRLNYNNYSSRYDKYAVEFQNGDSTLMKFGRARIKRNMDDNVTNDTSLNGLKSVFGDITNIRMTVTIELFVTCNKCHDVIALSSTEGKFVIKAGWYCLNCAKIVRTCGHIWQDCLFEDIEEKQKKHGLFFCLFRKICFICRETLRSENGGPIAHYRDKHENITFTTGEIFQLSSNKDSQYCLLDHQGDLMVCRYHFDDNEFHFAIRSPWQQEQIKEHRCYMTLAPVVISESMEPESRTYEMQMTLESFNDWQIDLKKWTFVDWCSGFDVCIKLERISV